MRTILLVILLLLSLSSYGQRSPWIPFNWEGDTISGKYFEKVAMTIPVSIDELPYKFNMQLDLGATTTVFYGNSINLYLEKSIELKSKIDTTLIFVIQGQQNYKFKNVNLKLGNVLFEKISIGYFRNFGDNIPFDSIKTNSEKHIGTIAPDLFQNKLLIIDYPNKLMRVEDNLPEQYKNATFQPYKIDKGRIKIPLKINNQIEYLMFDTGSSLFSLLTTEHNANEISGNSIGDSLKIKSWDEFYMIYAKTVKKNIYFGKKQLTPTTVFYDRKDKLGKFYDKEKIWGITGNAFFLNNTVIIDYRNKQFGVK